MSTKKPFVIGLTGSMGMGKSTTAAFFREAGIPVWDADSVVHNMYSQGGSAVAAIRELYPQAIKNDAVDRGELKDWISQDKTALTQIEKVVHPLLATNRNKFLEGIDTDIVVLDFPLLLETGAEKSVDFVVVVSAPLSVQRERILARSNMSAALLDTILEKQMPDVEKCARADLVIQTIELEDAKKAVQDLIKDIRGGCYA